MKIRKSVAIVRNWKMGGCEHHFLAMTWAAPIHSKTGSNKPLKRGKWVVCLIRFAWDTEKKEHLLLKYWIICTQICKLRLKMASRQLLKNTRLACPGQYFSSTKFTIIFTVPGGVSSISPNVMFIPSHILAPPLLLINNWTTCPNQPPLPPWKIILYQCLLSNFRIPTWINGLLWHLLIITSVYCNEIIMHITGNKKLLLNGKIHHFPVSGTCHMETRLPDPHKYYILWGKSTGQQWMKKIIQHLRRIPSDLYHIDISNPKKCYYYNLAYVAW